MDGRPLQQCPSQRCPAGACPRGDTREQRQGHCAHSQAAHFRVIKVSKGKQRLRGGSRLKGTRDTTTGGQSGRALDKESRHHCPHEQRPLTRPLPHGRARPSRLAARWATWGTSQEGARAVGSLTGELVRGWAPLGWRQVGAAHCLLWAGTMTGTCPPR